MRALLILFPMPRLNRRSDGGYFVTNSFTKGHLIIHTTYQVEPHALEILASRGIRSGDEFPKQLFRELLEEELLITGKSGPGEELVRNMVNPPTDSGKQLCDRRQIPLDVTSELLNEEGTFISFGRFKVQYGGPAGYDDDVLRSAYHTLHKKYQAGLPQQLNEILYGHKPTSIKTEAGKVIVEFVPR